jgi:hypothetical protein
MVVWGGFDGTFLGTGGRYDPDTDGWSSVSLTGAPLPRYDHTAVWTGTRMIVWAGTDGGYLASGGQYDPAADTWTATSLTGVPQGRYNHEAIWTGQTMLVWGGYAGMVLNTGGRYDPAGDSWLSISGAGAPSPRDLHTAVWTGSYMLIWGGRPAIQTGGRYAIEHTVDGDGDGLSECDGDCDDLNAATFPGATEVCDGQNNDCDDPNWPAVPAGEEDADGDSYRGCANDCDDTDANTYPGAPEINDGKDNQCEGSGLVDELTGTTGFFDPNDLTEYSWPAQPGATSYEVARADDPQFTVGCMTVTRSETFWQDPDLPADGAFFYYLVRPLAPNVGSWGENSENIERTNICP